MSIIENLHIAKCQIFNVIRFPASSKKDGAISKEM